MTSTYMQEIRDGVRRARIPLTLLWFCASAAGLGWIISKGPISPPLKSNVYHGSLASKVDNKECLETTTLQYSLAFQYYDEAEVHQRLDTDHSNFLSSALRDKKYVAHELLSFGDSKYVGENLAHPTLSLGYEKYERDNFCFTISIQDKERRVATNERFACNDYDEEINSAQLRQAIASLIPLPCYTLRKDNGGNQK